MERRFPAIVLPALVVLALVGLLLLFVFPADEQTRSIDRTGLAPTPYPLQRAIGDEAHLSGSGGRTVAAQEPQPRQPVEPPPSHDVVARIVGRVVDTQGRPVPGAEVHFRREGAGRTEHHTGDDGTYRLGVAWRGRYTIHGRAHGFGTGSVEGVYVDADGATQAPPLVLRGPGWFSGVVVFPDGTPGDGVAVEAAVSMQRGGSWAASPEPGLIHSRGVTDDKGRFRAAGLRLGPYAIKAPLVSEQDVTTYADHGQEDVRLVLRSKRIRLALRDESGHACPDAKTTITRVWGTRTGWGFSRSRREDDVLELWGLPGARDVVQWSAPGYIATERVFDFDMEPWSRDVTVVLREDDGSRGTVALTLQREDGTLIRGLMARVRSASGYHTVPDLRRVDADADEAVTLPPGRWTLEILPRVAVDDEDYDGYDFPARGPVEVVAGARRNLSLVSRRGGRVRVHAKRGPGIDPKADLTVSLGLVVPPERVEDPDLDYVDLGWFWDGVSPLSEIAAPGPWLLEVEGEGVKDELRPIVVRAGRTLDVHVTLVPDSKTEDAAEESDE